MARSRPEGADGRNANGKKRGGNSGEREIHSLLALRQRMQLQVMPSTTAAIATSRMAIDAASTVTVVANHRSNRSRRARKATARGHSEGTASRISTDIGQAPWSDRSYVWE